MPGLGLIPPAKPAVVYSFAVEPTKNALASICLLNEDLDGLSSWIETTRAAFSEDEKRRNELSCVVLPLANRIEAPDFPAWIVKLRKLDGAAFARGVVVAMTEQLSFAAKSDESPPNPEVLLADRGAFLAYASRMETAAKGECEDDFYIRLYSELIDPERFRDAVADHLTMVWTRFLASESLANRDNLEQTVKSFSEINLTNKPFETVFKLVTERDELPEWFKGRFGDIREVQFIPSPHVGPYLMLLEYGDGRARIVVRAHPPKAKGQAAAHDRSELVMRLAAIGDETRLSILQLVAAENELSSQAIMERLNLSQSSVSRHLSQLAATGFLNVRTADRNKLFSVRKGRLESICASLRSCLAPEGEGGGADWEGRRI